MTERKLKINLEPLWNNPNELFTVRYKDINEKSKKILAKRIKDTTKIISLRKTTGPTIEIIEQVLYEINPIIFSECQRGENQWRRGYQLFGISGARYIAGYNFDMLCKGIYLLTCRKKELTIDQIKRICYLTHSDWSVVTDFVNRILRINQDDEERITPIEDLGIEDIHRATERATRNNIQNIENRITPDENYDIIDQETHLDQRPEINNPTFRGRTLRFDTRYAARNNQLEPTIVPIPDERLRPNPRPMWMLEDEPNNRNEPEIDDPIRLGDMTEIARRLGQNIIETRNGEL